MGALIAVLIASLAWLVSLLVVGVVLTNDGPSHLLQCHVFASLGDASSPYAGHFSANVPVTARGSCELQLVLERFLSWRAIHQLLLGMPSVLFSLAAWTAARAVHPARAWTGVLVAALPAHTLIYYGLFPYALGAAVAALGIALAVTECARARATRWRTALASGALLVVVALAHAVAALFFAILAGVVLVVGASDARAAARALLRHALCGLPALVVLARALGYSTDVSDAMATRFLSFALHLKVQLAWAQAGGTARELVALGLPALGVAVTALRWRSATRAERALAAAGLTALALFWVLPQDARGFLIFSPRALVFFVVFGIAALPLERLAPRLRAFVPIVAIALCAVQLAWLHGFHAERARAADAVLAFVDEPVAAPGVRLPLPLDPYLGRDSGEAWGIFGWVPGMHVGQVYALRQGGAVEYSQDRRATTQWALRSPASRRGVPPDLLELFARLPSTAARVARARAVARAGARWDGVIVVGDRDEQAVFTQLGYRVEHGNDAVMLARFVGCPLAIRASDLPEGRELVVTVRAAGDVEPWLVATMQRGPGEADPVAQLGGGAGPPAPCGGVVVEAQAPFACEGGPRSAELPRDASIVCSVRAR
ncbi:MAG: hypothetical protein IT383_00220 [Deltaproteobacteria bacterium]|nr:hypothetical protein [Deltaproteobacteria bacterium]